MQAVACVPAWDVRPWLLYTEAEIPRPMEHRDPPSSGELTMLLRAWSDGDEQAFDQVVPLVYGELHRMALRSLAGERSPSLQATALVNEVCVRLLGWDQVRWENRRHFFAV